MTPLRGTTMHHPCLQSTFLMPRADVRLASSRIDDGEPVRILRDDLLDPLCGGNKLRKLDAWWPRLVREGITDVVTCGGAQSSFATAVALLAARHGQRAHLALRGEPPEVLSGYAFWSSYLGHVHWVDRDRYADRDRMLNTLAADVSRGGRKVAILPEGGAGAPAMPGLVRLIHALTLELSDPWQTRWRLVLDSATATTATGLAIGIAALKLPWEIHGVLLMQDGFQEAESTKGRLTKDFENEWGPLPAAPQVVWSERTPPRRFGTLLPNEVRDCRALARQSGILVDPVYTLAALDAVRIANRRARQRTVWVHTGGVLGLEGIASRDRSWAQSLQET